MKVPQMLAKQQAEKEAAKKHRSSREPEKKTNQTQMMQYYMMAMILVFGLMWPSAMAVYWAVNSLVMIVKTFAVQAIINNRKEAAR
ncbi:MAG: YidC/Oxa1 family membrane protein insertase, partial [Solobacterium sp.]|nr:YidC/Oxa1 family membrane protein insertase [Solobacterium sp.]